MVSQAGNMRHDSPQENFPETQKMGVGRYLATRLPSLKPPMAEAPNPLKALRMLNLYQWLFFLVAFFAWTWDSFDFFTVSLTIEELSKEFGKTPSQITWGITLVLSMGSGCTS
jgi:SHS family lactate transporter-like MFS transporter